MRNINKLASLLDRAGEYNLADKLDKIAQNNYMNPEQAYKSYIQQYVQALKQNSLENNPETIILEFNNW